MKSYSKSINIPGVMGGGGAHTGPPWATLDDLCDLGTIVFSFGKAERNDTTLQTLCIQSITFTRAQMQNANNDAAIEIKVI